MARIELNMPDLKLESLDYKKIGLECKERVPKEN